MQPAYALTIHKCQGLTLPHVSLYLDDSLFEAGQAYVALSRARRLEDVQILALDPAAFKANPEVAAEYARLTSRPQLPLW